MHTILVHIGDGQQFQCQLTAARALAQRLGAHVEGLIVKPLSPAPYGPAAHDIDQVLATAHAKTRSEAEALLKRIRDEENLDCQLLVTRADRVVIDAASRMRIADLIVIAPQRRDASLLDDDLFEAALFSSARPTLLVPANAETHAIGRNVAIAWKDTREAALAIHMAMPILSSAESVCIVACKPADSNEHFGRPAIDRLEAMLRKRGAPVSGVEVIDSNPSAGAAILEQVKGADLLVMGGYGHMRVTEMIFGGVTRHVVAHANLPVLLAH